MTADNWIPDPGVLDHYVDLGFVARCRRVERGHTLALYNYTGKCERERVWSETTRRCRGLVLEEETGRVVALPFDKFFNLGQAPEATVDALLWHLPSAIVEKYDGTLGIVFFDFLLRCWDIVTRGAFDSPQANRARERLLPRLIQSALDADFTYLFEILGGNCKCRIVRYAAENMVLIGRRSLRTGKLDWPEGLPGLAVRIGEQPVVIHVPHGGIDSFLDEMRTAWKGSEGVVVTFHDGRMVKVKTEEFGRRIAAVKWLSRSDVFVRVANDSQDELLRAAPAHLLEFVSERVAERVRLRDSIIVPVHSLWEALRTIGDRKWRCGTARIWSR